jgi:hypothetical protein
MTSEDDANDKQFSVCRFSADGTYAYVARWIDLYEAVKVLRRCTEDFDSQVGSTTRIIITDGGDLINLEWQYGEGITFPTKEMMEAI